jgi:hypothetical protein
VEGGGEVGAVVDEVEDKSDAGVRIDVGVGMM